MSSFVMIEGFQYCELDDVAKRKALVWLDEFPFDYENEVENENGEIVVVTEYGYASDWSDTDVQEFCFDNGYIFDKNGKPIHDLILTRYEMGHRLNNTSVTTDTENKEN